MNIYGTLKLENRNWKLELINPVFIQFLASSFGIQYSILWRTLFWE